MEAEEIPNRPLPGARVSSSVLELMLLGVLALGLALVAALSPSMWAPIGLLGLTGGVLLLLFRPLVVLCGLLVIYAIYVWLDAAVLPLLSPIVSVAIAGLREAGLLGLVLMAYFKGRTGQLPGTFRLWLGAFALLVLALAVIPAAPAVPSVLSARFHLQYLLLLPISALLAGGTRGRKWVLYTVLGVGASVAGVWLSALGWAGLSGLQYQMATTQVLFGENSEVVNAINVLGIYMAVLLCLLAGLARHASRLSHRTTLIALSFLIGWALLSTFSRRSILALLVGGLVIVVVSRQWRTLFWGGAMGFVVLAYSSTQLLRRLSWDAADETGGVSLRMEHLLYTVENLDPLALFVGHGIGTSGDIAVEAGIRNAVDIHNYYLLLLFEAGVFGLLLYVLVCGVAMRYMVKAYRTGGLVGMDRGLVLGTIGAFAAFLLAGLFGVTNATIPVAPIMWTLVGCSVALARPASSSPPAVAPSAPWFAGLSSPTAGEES